MVIRMDDYRNGPKLSYIPVKCTDGSVVWLTKEEIEKILKFRKCSAEHKTWLNTLLKAMADNPENRK